MVSVTLTGERLHLALGVRGYEFETARDSHDKNWLRKSVALEVGPPSERIVVSNFEVFWQTTELSDFELQLSGALAKQKSLSGGKASLTTLEDEVELQVMVRLDDATISGRIEKHSVAAVEFAETVTTAQELEGALSELAEVTREFPFRS